ncbi:MAG: glycosyltransferase family 1 protein [Patescibacteria group bacterium]
MSNHIVIDARIRRSSTGRYVDRLVEHLQAIDHENRYTVLAQPDDPWQPVAKNFAREDCGFAQFSFNPMDQIKFPRQLRKLQPDLIHFPMNQQPVFYAGKVVTSTLDLTMLSFTRAGKTPLPIFWLKMLGYRFLFARSNKKSKAVITISNYVKDALAKKYPFTIGKTFTTYCASEPPLLVKAVEPAIAQNSLLKTQGFLLYVGAAFPHKNLETLIKAFEIANAAHPELNLILVGKREYYYEKLEQFAEDSPARASIIFTGFIPDEELKWLYENAEMYVFPSLSEGFGLPGLEAMVHGCPVISSNATCLPEVYEDAALYFDPHNTEDMAEKIQIVLSDKNIRQNLIEAGHIQAAKFSWRRMAEQTLEIYQKVLAD